MKFWIISYALTTGIMEAECEIYRGYATNKSMNVFAKIGTNAFETESEARARVLQVANRKIESLAKQIEKMKSIAAKYEATE